MEPNSNQNLLSMMERISSSASTCALNFQNLDDVTDDIGEVSGFLGITKDQSVFFSCLAELSFRKTVSIDSLAKHLKCSVMNLITLMHELEALEKKRYIQKHIKKTGRKYSYFDIGYTVPHSVIEAIRKRETAMLTPSSKLDLPGFLNQASNLVEDRRNEDISTATLLTETEFLISNNLDLPFVSFVNLSLSLTLSKCFVFALSLLRLKGEYIMNNEFILEGVFDDFGEQLDFSHQIVTGNHELIMKRILKLEYSEFEGDKTVVLSDNSLKILYQDYPALLISNKRNLGLISSKSIIEKKLFFNESVKDQIGSLENVFKATTFKKYRKALQNNKLSSGITSIFFGAPGTGKTEAVYQIARKTGRDIMMIDLSQTKSKWFGESEKMVKKIFDDYSDLVKSRDIEPILFINEADGLFTKRIDLNRGRGTSSEQTINLIQNILLQELENFEGILIATTNLTENLDKAFERRFSFRINFSKPDARARQKIWKSKLPELSERNATALGEKFDMTGGEIDVQIRQVILKKVLNRKVKLYELLVDNCNKNQGFTTRRKIGF